MLEEKCELCVNNVTPGVGPIQDYIIGDVLRARQFHNLTVAYLLHIGHIYICILHTNHCN